MKRSINDGSRVTGATARYNGLHVSGDLAGAGGSSTFHFMFGHPDMGPDFLTRYALETDLTMVSDARVAASWMP